MKTKDPKRVKQGKRNRINGGIFERLVRKDLIEKYRIVSKWQNNVRFDIDDKGKCYYKGGKCIPAKMGKFRTNQSGFPDFICYRNISLDKIGMTLNLTLDSGKETQFDPVVVIFCEVKTNGRLNPEEKAKAKWYLDNNFCSKFLVASKYKEKGRVKIKYEEFEK